MGGAKPDGALEGVSPPRREGARSRRARAALTSVGETAPRDPMASADGLDVGTTAAEKDGLDVGTTAAEGCGWAIAVDAVETPSSESGGAADIEARWNTDVDAVADE